MTINSGTYIILVVKGIINSLLPANGVILKGQFLKDIFVIDILIISLKLHTGKC